MSKTVLFQAIQFSISTKFTSIWPIDKNLPGAITLGQSEPGIDGNEGVLCIPQSSIIRLFSVISRTLILGSLTPLQRRSRSILQPQPTEQSFQVG